MPTIFPIISLTKKTHKQKMRWSFDTRYSDGKESACNAGDLGSVPGSGRFLGEGHGYSLQYSCLGNAHGQRSLVGYSPRGLKESDTTEWLTLSLSWSTIGVVVSWCASCPSGVELRWGLARNKATMSKSQFPLLLKTRNNPSLPHKSQPGFYLQVGIVMLEKTLEGPLDCKEI